MMALGQHMRGRKREGERIVGENASATWSSDVGSNRRGSGRVAILIARYLGASLTVTKHMLMVSQQR
jgi:hypothetical protein